MVEGPWRVPATDLQIAQVTHGLRCAKLIKYDPENLADEPHESMFNEDKGGAEGDEEMLLATIDLLWKRCAQAERLLHIAEEHLSRVVVTGIRKGPYRGLTPLP